jgi:hypothetical protein
MARAQFKVTTLLVFALLFSAVQCVGSCASESCNPAGAEQSPRGGESPCHRHQQTPAHETPLLCAPDFLLPGTGGFSITQVSVAGSAIGSLIVAAIVSQSPVVADAPAVPVFLMPDLTPASRIVLRI